MTIRKRLIFSFVFLFVFGGSVLAAPGDLDVSFGAGGSVVTPFTAVTDYIEDIALQRDGKIIAVGRIGFDAGSSGKSYFGVARYNADGTLDTTFGKNGYSTTDFNTQFAFPYSVSLHSDGKILVAGYIISVNTPGQAALARFLPNGTPDPDFGNNGLLTLKIGLSSAAYAVMAQANGKIVVVGTTTSATGQYNYDIFVARLLHNGIYDKRFGFAGKVVTQIANSSEIPVSVKIQPDNKIVIGGTLRSEASADRFLVMRYNERGRLDSTFDADGLQTTAFDQPQALAFDMALQTDGKIIIGGYASPGSSGNMYALVRYDPNGALDSTFDADGKVTTASGGMEGVGHAIAVQSDGKILVAGSVRKSVSPFDSDALVMRYNPDGSLDSGFGAAGRAKAVLSPENDEIWALAIQPDGRVIGGGFAINGATGGDFALTRFLTR